MLANKKNVIRLTDRRNIRLVCKLLVCGYLINPLSLKVLSRSLSSFIAGCCQHLITLCSEVEITQALTFYFPPFPLLCIVLFFFFHFCIAESSALWRQIVICSFASLTPPHMALENWKWKQWKLMLCLPPFPCKFLPSSIRPLQWHFSKHGCCDYLDHRPVCLFNQTSAWVLCNAQKSILISTGKKTIHVAWKNKTPTSLTVSTCCGRK